MANKKVNDNSLTSQQLEFCYAYIANKFNDRKAGLAAHYSKNTVDQQVSRLLSNVKVQKKIRELTKLYFKPLGFKAQDVLNELAILGFSDMKDFIILEKGKAVSIKEMKELGINSRCIREMEIEEKIVGEDNANRLTIKLRKNRRGVSGIGFELQFVNGQILEI